VTSSTQVLNFSAGPAVLPHEIYSELEIGIRNFNASGIGVMELSHRSAEFEQVLADAESAIRSLLAIPPSHHVLFLQGGASHLFSLLPLAYETRNWTILVNGSWGEKCAEAARAWGPAQVKFLDKESGYRRAYAELEVAATKSPIIHITSNETIQGVQGTVDVLTDGHLIADMSSDILSRPIPWNAFSLVYAGAQKNLGPAGVTFVVIRDDFLAQARMDLPPMFNLPLLVKNRSLYNTPPTWSIFVLRACLKHWLAQGGLPAIQARNAQKASAVYEAIDRSNDFYSGHSEMNSRSEMNVTFRLPNDELNQQFLIEAETIGMVGLAGHRSVGGVRASLYNALPVESAVQLAEFMDRFRSRHG
jgi:phosphoserine aminotransferase